MLSTGAFNALLKTMEEPPSHALFLLATTEIHKVPATIVSRCQRFDFRRVPAQTLIARLASLAEHEQRRVEPAVFTSIARHADGCVRDAESLLGQLFALGEDPVTEETASLIIPSVSQVLVVDLATAALSGDAARALSLVNESVEQGVGMARLSEDLLDLFRTLLLVKLGGEGQFGTAYSQETIQRLSPSVSRTSVEVLTQAVEHLLDAKATRSERIPQLGLEIALVKISGLVSPPTTLPTQAQQIPGKPGDSGDAGVSQGSQGSQWTRNHTSFHDSKNPSDASNSPPATPTTPETPAPPLFTLEEVKNKWPAIFEKIKACNASLPMVVQSENLQEVNGNEVVMKFSFRLYADTVNQPKNRLALESVFEQVLGTKVFVKGIYAQEEADDTINVLTQNFGGSAI
jgi:DNA polymerase-3 subunit gamma/tau